MSIIRKKYILSKYVPFHTGYTRNAVHHMLATSVTLDGALVIRLIKTKVVIALHNNKRKQNTVYEL